MSSFRKTLQWIVLCGICISPAVYGQIESRMHVTVPFAFHVGGKDFPAGEYNVKASPGQPTVLLQSADYSRAQFVLTNAVRARTLNERPSLVFNRYGTDYFLSTIWLAGSETGRQLTPSTQERELARKLLTPGKEILVGKAQAVKR